VRAIIKRQTTGARLIVALVCLAWAAIVALVLSHRIFVTGDSLNNYAHVWYASQRLWHEHTIPLRMPVLGHGEAFAFPYGFIPWFTAALLRPLLGDWVVTLWLVLGALGVVAAGFWALPELRRGCWPALVLVNPPLLDGLMAAQMSFLWSVLMFFAAVGFWRRNRLWAAVLLCGLSQATHPPVMMPIVGVCVLIVLWRDPAVRPRLLPAYIVTLVIALPAALIVLLSPTMADTSRAVQLSNLLVTVGYRSGVIVLPFVLVWLQRHRPSAARWLFPGLLVLNLLMLPPRDGFFAWGALLRQPDQSLLTYTSSSQFVPGATYRILRIADGLHSDGKVGMYQLLQAGARLDSEFFPESIDRRSWNSTADYAGFLQRRHVDYVLIYDDFGHHYGSNEQDLLRQLAEQPVTLESLRLCTTLQVRQDGYDVFQVHRAEPDTGSASC